VTGRKIAATVVALVVLLSASAAAEPAPDQKSVADAGVDQETVTSTKNRSPEPVRVTVPATLTADGGATLEVPAGAIILWPETWEALDTGVRSLEERATRAEAERDSYRRTARESGPGWGTVLLASMAFVAGIAAAEYALH
jgi:hypothetical protein